MEEFNEERYKEVFTKPIIKYGRLTNLLAIPLCFLPAIVLWVFYGAKPLTQDILTGWGLTASIYGIYAIIEPISFFPVLGLPGTYMGCLSGNINSIRVPSSAMAQDSIGVMAGTKKAELVSTLGIAGSIVTNLVIVTIAAVGGAALLSIFPPVIMEALEYVAPAIMGSVFGMNAMKNIKYGLFAFILSMSLLLFFNIPAYVMIPFLVFATVAFAFVIDLINNKRGV